MNLELVFLISAILCPLVVNLIWRRPDLLLLAASVSYILTGFLLTTEAGIALSQWLLTDRAYHDTYYVVAKGYWLNIGVVMLFLSAVAWVQVKVGAMRHDNLTKALIWTLHLGLLFFLGLPEIFTTFSVMPRRYVDYPDYFYAFNPLTNSALIVVATALIGLIALMVWSLYRTWMSRRAP
ncbi:MAG: hypothetical protein AAGI50_10075 [Pseudomonadota bacterium]